VTICSSNAAFNGALRLALDDYDVQMKSRLGDADPNTDLLVWWLDGEIMPDRLAAIAPRVPTLVLAEESQLIPAVDAGCRGFLTESASLDEIRVAVETILEGGAVVPPDLLGTLLHHVVQRRRRELPNVETLSDLTDREREVFQLAAEGLRKDEIGERLYMSPATARTHLQRIYRKLGVHSQSELMALGGRRSDVEGEEAV
jgi:DNA-binding NarL/FixJ family response regulator